MSTTDHEWDRYEAEPVVIPSRLSTEGVSAVSPPVVQDAASAESAVPQPRRVEHELVAGKPVFVLYRPSRGLEVRDDNRDTDHVVL